MNTNSNRYPILPFVVLMLGVFFLVAIAGEAAARMSVKGEDFSLAISDALLVFRTEPVGMIFLAIPFALVGWICAAHAKKSGLAKGFILCLLGGGALAVLFFQGAFAEQHALKDHAWTAAALSIGFVPFESIPVLLACFVVRWIAEGKKPPAETRPEA